MRTSSLSVIIAACALGCHSGDIGDSAGQPATAQTTGAPKESASGNRFPFQVAQDGWSLTEDCTLNLGASPYTRETAAGKFIFSESVSIIPKGKGEVAYRLRPTGQSLKDATVRRINYGFGPQEVSTEKPIIKLYADQIPLKPSMGLKENDGKTIIAGGAEGNSLGGEVTTNEV